MQFIDFEYDGISLSSKGMRVLSFDGAQDDTITTDSQRNFNSISLFGGRYQPFVYSNYEDRLEIDFSIGKNICSSTNTTTTTNSTSNEEVYISDNGAVYIGNGSVRDFTISNTGTVEATETNSSTTVSDGYEDFYLTVSQLESLQYWLNRPTAHKFKILQEAEYANIYWEGSFNLEWIKSGENVIGADLHFISNRPFALGEKEIFTEENFGENETPLYIIDSSSEEGTIMPTVEITLKEDGDLELTNTFNGEEIKTIVTGCKKDEVITFSNVYQLTSSDTTHKIMDCFNWIFPRIYNVYGNNINVFTSNLKCECTISYNPIRKVTFS